MPSCSATAPHRHRPPASRPPANLRPAPHRPGALSSLHAMTTTPAQADPGLGPAPFRFAPTGGAVEGASFSPFFKLIATAIVALCGAWLWRLWQQQAFVGVAGFWFVAGWVMMAATWVAVLRARTRIGADALRQRWVWEKRLPLDDLAYCKLIRVPRLEWLFAPRLYARTLMGKFGIFYLATPELITEADRLCRELRALRRGQA